MLLNPHHPFLYLIFRARALFGLERYYEALVDIEVDVLSTPGHSNGSSTPDGMSFCRW